MRWPPASGPYLVGLTLLDSAGHGGGRDRGGMQLLVRELARTLGAELATLAVVEPIGLEQAGLGVQRSTRISHAVGAPVRPLAGPVGVLWAGFSSGPPDDLARALWLVESYAHVAALCLHDRDALDGPPVGGRLDGLTGCLTQAAFMHELEREIHRADRHGGEVSCCFIDLDRFKRVNDRHGHLHWARSQGGRRR